MMTDRLIARRGVVAGGAAATLLTGCATCADLKPLAASDQRRRIGDAHVHLFNAADLPVAGFLRDVLLPEHAPNLPEVALALADIGARILKSFAISARMEQGRMRPPGSADAAPDISAARFADAVADRIETVTRGKDVRSFDALRPLDETDDSYVVLAALLAEGRAKELGQSGPLSAPGATDAMTTVDRGYLARIAERGSEAPQPDAPTALFTMQGDKAALNVSIAGVWAAIKWCWLMVQSRCYHVHRYLAFADTSAAAVTDIVNLLVDYDAWLQDAPAPGSVMADQLRFWTDYASRAAPRVAIHTFAGYDPLRHAESTKPGGGDPGYFAALTGWFDGTDPAHRVAGFKLYPPMGFQVVDNKGLRPKTDRSGARVRANWNRHGWPLDTFGADLDAALDGFFAFCGERDVPVLAHGRKSNAASSGTGAMASPSWWLKRAQRMAAAGHRLRACIGHFDHRNADAMAGLKGLLKLDRDGLANAYLDIGYTEEFLTGGGDAIVEQLAVLFERKPDAARFLLFGSDWIMLAQEPRADRYVETVMNAFARHAFWRDHIADVFGGNLARYLKRQAG